MATTVFRHSCKAAIVDLTARADASAYTSDAIGFRTETIGATIYILSTLGGSLQFQVYLGEPDSTPDMPDANWQNLGTARVIVANTLDTFTLNQGLPPIRAIWTPTDATSHNMKVLVWGFGG